MPENPDRPSSDDPPNDVNLHPLVDAARNGETGVIDQLLASGAAVDATDEAGRTALMAAAFSSHLEATEHLIAYGANVALKDDQDQTALHYAASAGAFDIMWALLNAGADPGAQSLSGTPAEVAYANGHYHLANPLAWRARGDGRAGFFGVPANPHWNPDEAQRWYEARSPEFNRLPDPLEALQARAGLETGFSLSFGTISATDPGATYSRLLRTEADQLVTFFERRIGPAPADLHETFYSDACTGWLAGFFVYGERDTILEHRDTRVILATARKVVQVFDNATLPDFERYIFLHNLNATWGSLEPYAAELGDNAPMLGAMIGHAYRMGFALAGVVAQRSEELSPEAKTWIAAARAFRIRGAARRGDG